MSQLIRYVEAVNIGTTLIRDVKADEGKGISVHLGCGQVYDLLDDFGYTEEQLRNSFSLKGTLRNGFIKIFNTKEDFLKRKEELSKIPVVSNAVNKVIYSDDDDNPYLKELENVEAIDLAEGQTSRKIIPGSRRVQSAKQ